MSKKSRMIIGTRKYLEKIIANTGTIEQQSKRNVRTLVVHWYLHIVPYKLQMEKVNSR
jgi:hypothetical protein